MTQVVRLQNPKALASPPFRAFLKRSVKRGALIGLDDLLQGLTERLPDPNFLALVGVEDGEFRGLVLLGLPSSIWQPTPYVYHFYNAGKAALRDALIKATVDFVVQAGYTKFLAVNLSDRDFKAWAKTFQKAGKATELGRLVEFEVG